ncbi:MAG: hypothetical protein ACRDTD_27945, partial [Pseudonocardiaceae bacterium]
MNDRTVTVPTNDLVSSSSSGHPSSSARWWCRRTALDPATHLHREGRSPAQWSSFEATLNSRLAEQLYDLVRATTAGETGIRW